jgi:hypothetical protein
MASSWSLSSVGRALDSKSKGHRFKSGRLQTSEMSWPSGLRRNVKAVVFIGVGSNPTDIKPFPGQTNIRHWRDARLDYACYYNLKVETRHGLFLTSSLVLLKLVPTRLA